MGLSAPTAVAPYQNLHRLPRGDDGKTSAGYAMATAAAGAAAFYFVVQIRRRASPLGDRRDRIVGTVRRIRRGRGALRSSHRRRRRRVAFGATFDP